MLKARFLYLGALAFLPVIAHASPCQGNFRLNANGYEFNVRLDNGAGGIVGSMDEISGPTWENSHTAIDGQCDGTVLWFTRYLNNSYQHYTAYPMGDGWTGTFTHVNTTARTPFVMSEIPAQ